MKLPLAAVLILTTVPDLLAAPGGTVVLNNRVTGIVITHVYAPDPANPYFSQIGNGTNDTTAGSTSWAGFTAIGTNGFSGQYGASNTVAQLLSAPGFNQPEFTLASSTPTTTFRTGRAAGNVLGTTATLSNVPQDAPQATIELVAWDNSSALYSTWETASVAWQAGLIAAGRSNPFNLTYIGGNLNPPPFLVGLQSFNLYYIPEPSTLALTGLTVTVLLVLRKRRTSFNAWVTSTNTARMLRTLVADRRIGGPACVCTPTRRVWQKLAGGSTHRDPPVKM